MRDELLLLLAAHPGGLSLDAVWPALRSMVRARPDSYSPVNAGRLDKPDRTMQALLRTAGFASLSAFLATLPEVALSGAGPSARAALTPEAAARLLGPDGAPPPQPLADAAGAPALIVLRRPRVRDLSAQLLGLGPDWRAAATQRGEEHLAELAAARAQLAAAGGGGRDSGGARAAAAHAARAPRGAGAGAAHRGASGGERGGRRSG